MIDNDDRLRADLIEVHERAVRAEQEVSRLKSVMQAEIDGAMAYLTGNGLDFNHHPVSTELWHLWRKGWERVSNTDRAKDAERAERFAAAWKRAATMWRRAGRETAAEGRPPALRRALQHERELNEAMRDEEGECIHNPIPRRYWVARIKAIDAALASSAAEQRQPRDDGGGQASAPCPGFRAEGWRSVVTVASPCRFCGRVSGEHDD